MKILLSAETRSERARLSRRSSSRRQPLPRPLPIKIGRGDSLVVIVILESFDTLSASRERLDDEDFAVGGDAVGERPLVAREFIAAPTPPPAPPH